MVTGIIFLYISSRLLFTCMLFLFFMGWRNMAGSGLLSNGTAVIGIQVLFIQSRHSKAICTFVDEV